MAKKGSSVISTGRVKDGVPMRGRPPGAHSGMRGRPPLHGVKHHQSSALDDASSLRYKVCFLVPFVAYLFSFVSLFVLTLVKLQEYGDSYHHEAMNSLTLSNPVP